MSVRTARRSHRLRRSIAAGAALIVLAGVPLVGSSILAGASSPRKAKVFSLTWDVTNASAASLPLFAMQQSSIARKNNIELTPNYFADGSSQEASAFAIGIGDLEVGGIDGLVSLEQRGLDNITVLGTATQKNLYQLCVLASSPIKSLSELGGKSVAISGPATPSDYWLSSALVQNKLSPNFVVKTSLGGTPAQLAALLGGQVVAAQLQAPYLEDALTAGQVRCIYNLTQKMGVLGTTVVGARTADVRADPQEYTDFVRAYRETMQRLATNKQFAYDMATAFFGATVTALDLQETISYFYQFHIWPANGLYTRQIHDNSRKDLLQSGQFSAVGYPTFAQLTRNAPKS